MPLVARKHGVAMGTHPKQQLPGAGRTCCRSPCGRGHVQTKWLRSQPIIVAHFQGKFSADAKAWAGGGRFRGRLISFATRVRTPRAQWLSLTSSYTELLRQIMRNLAAGCSQGPLLRNVSPLGKSDCSGAAAVLGGAGMSIPSRLTSTCSRLAQTKAKETG
jgi:hypothetical protein